MKDILAHLEGTSGTELCFRDEYIDFYGSEKVLSVDLQKALEKAVELGSRKIVIKIQRSDEPSIRKKIPKKWKPGQFRTGHSRTSDETGEEP